MELEAGLAGGVFGRLAAGRSNMFWAADPGAVARQLRRERRRRPTEQERADMGRSELLASVCVPLWELRTGRRATPPQWFGRPAPDLADPELVARILDRLDAFAARLHELAPGQSITVPWAPAATTGRGSAHRRTPSRASRRRRDAAHVG